MRQIRMLRRRVVPESMREVIYSAYHSSGMAGHVGIHKTYYRIIARYWWPNVFADVKRNVNSCGFCVLGNNTSHKAQQILGKIDTDEPFDVISIDIWIPGDTIPEAQLKRIKKDKRVKQASLTGICSLTGFVMSAFLSSLDSLQKEQKATFIK